VGGGSNSCQLQLWLVQVWDDRVQSVQAAPFSPQAVSTVPAWQALLASQQPLQWLIRQGLPQPSSAPWHLPLQLGKHLHFQPAHFSPLAAQSTQAAPARPQALSAVPG
jgi:hypothetical protein